MYVCIYVCMNGCMDVYVYIFVYACITYVCMYVTPSAVTRYIAVVQLQFNYTRVCVCVQSSLFPVICSADPDIDTTGGDVLQQHLVKQALCSATLNFPVYA